MMNKKANKIVFGIAITLVCSTLTLYFSTFLHFQLKYGGFSVVKITPLACFASIASDEKHRVLFLALNGVVIFMVAAFMFCQLGRSYESALLTLTPKIRTPVRAGQNQHGSARWLERSMFHKAFAMNVIHLGDGAVKNLTQPIFKSGGIVIGAKRTARKEALYYIDDDTHTLCIGAMRSGKSRTVVLQSIGLQALSGESMIMSDPKGELFQYTYPFLQQLGYEVIAIDFKNPLKSHRYNFLQNVIDACKANNLSKAIDCAWDITTSLVGEAKGERIWNDGESSVIASSILSMVYDNMSKPQYQNLTNVYYFISEMCRMAGEEMPINKYLKTIDSQHPARALLGISEVAPQKTKGSFFTVALTTLRLFTNPFIYSMTCASDFEHMETGSKKRAIFIILPDEKTTYYSLASLFISQHYETLVNVADARGGRLLIRVNLNLDECGKFTVIPSFANKLTVGGGRGIRFNLFVQSLAQLNEKYGKEVSKTVKGNCQNWIYLQAEDIETLEELSKKLGNYTVASNSHSTSYTRNSRSSTSASSNLIGDRTNSNIVVTGVAGVGKSTVIKHIILSEYMKGTKIIIIDPEREYKELCENLKGDWINAGGSNGGLINPLEIRAAPRDEETEENPLYNDEGNGMGDMALHLKTLEIFFSLYIPSLTDIQKALLKETLEELYFSFNISWDTDVSKLKSTDFPTFKDLYDLIVRKGEANNSRNISELKGVNYHSDESNASQYSQLCNAGRKLQC